MEVQWKHPDGTGGYEVIHYETTAEMVTYSDTTVARVLSDTGVLNIRRIFKYLFICSIF